jgi:hypothetical protein
MRDARRGSRAVTLVRTALIGYGTAAISVLLARSGVQQAAVPVGLVAAGIGLQVVLVIVRARIAKSEAGASSAAEQAIGVLETVGDGITVLLFALATLGAVVGAAGTI